MIVTKYETTKKDTSLWRMGGKAQTIMSPMEIQSEKDHHVAELKQNNHKCYWIITGEGGQREGVTN